MRADFIVYDVTMSSVVTRKFRVTGAPNARAAANLVVSNNGSPRVVETFDVDGAAFVSEPMVTVVPVVLDANARIVWWLLSWLLGEG